MTSDELDTFYGYWRTWFAQPEAEKLKHLRMPGGKGGFYPAFSESPGYTGKPDPKEYFHFRTNHFDTINSPITAGLFGECYGKAQQYLYDRGLLDELLFGPERCVLRILHYLPTPDGLVGEAHRDFDLLTVSVPGTVPGLEVLHNSHTKECNDRSDAFPEISEEHPECYGCAQVWEGQEEGIQVGEMLEIYDAHHYPNSWMKEIATTHRVRTPPNTERYKAVFFYLPTNGFELRPGYTSDDYLKDALTKAGTIGIGAK